MTTIAINLLPHRIEKRKQRRRDFFTLAVITAVSAAILVLLVGGIIQTYIYAQTARNEFIKQENAALDKQIAEVASLKEEIDALRARQTAVEDLQSDRNMPVYMLDELVKLTPEGVYLKSIKQEGQKVTLLGYAQSNERVSEALRNFANKSPWIEKPNLIEIKLGLQALNNRGPRLYEFAIEVLLKRPSSIKDAVPAAGVTPGAAK
jgi:type IV pilus assembly protein PilN